MANSDPIADMLTRIRNANLAYLETVEIPASKIKTEIARILKEEGYINDFVVDSSSGHDIIRIHLKYGPKKERVITGLKRVSKPGRRIYVGKDNVPRVLRGLGIAIISTSKGLLTDRDARRLGEGGEVICYVW
ncbi:MAG: 30S ribosomal protein S8 [Coprothermobacterota bacterium]|jgi:small subunit ribosomal protein S8|nr:30S ribosomal protein S8 [Caldisericota bacterium]MDI6869148.1 30S ribosomal protein S8 [Coprothermobacterota bacterium]